MPRKLIGVDEQRILNLWRDGGSCRGIGEVVGLSRSAVQRILASHVKHNQLLIKPARKAAGLDPLPVGHPLSWSAISTAPFERRA